jgi:putative lipoic acid-binding regulatory protein
MDQKELFYQRLENKLNEETRFPSNYLFKFIVHNSESLILEVMNVFDGMAADFKQTPSKNGKFVSVSILVKVESANQVIKKYKQAAFIEGIISL